MILARYVLTLHGPDEPEQGPRAAETSARVLANLPAMLEAVEEDLLSILPENFEVRIERDNA